LLAVDPGGPARGGHESAHDAPRRGTWQVPGASWPPGPGRPPPAVPFRFGSPGGHATGHHL